jgi:2-polyprenyl-6-methoxyphenol hydroxylase-like FAD-dependent oxidoreductase
MPSMRSAWRASRCRKKFRARFGNPYAVIHRADIHGALLEGVKATTDGIEFLTSTKVVHIEQDDHAA